jgi:FkbM family methyltransferase
MKPIAANTCLSQQDAEQFEKAEVRAFFKNSQNGVFVEVGANDPVAVTSQTWHLEQLGWSGVLIEPIEHLCAIARKKRPASKIVNVACTSSDTAGYAELKIPVVAHAQISAHAGLNPELDQSGYQRWDIHLVKARTLDSVLEDNGISNIDFLSIDVEGTELDVLKGFSFSKHRPKLVLIEDKLVYLDKHRFLRRQGYRLLRRTGFNNWYIPAETLHCSPSGEQLRLFRKIYLSLPLRRLKVFIKKRKQAGRAR